MQRLHFLKRLTPSWWLASALAWLLMKHWRDVTHCLNLTPNQMEVLACNLYVALSKVSRAWGAAHVWWPARVMARHRRWSHGY